MTALIPRSLSARVRMTAVVRLPMAPSVPSTAMRGQVTVSIAPVNMRRSFLGRGRRTSSISTPYLAAAAVNSRSSFRNSCRPLTMYMPRRMASSTTPRWCGESRPLSGATPRMKKSGTRPASAMAVREVGADRDAVRDVVEVLAGVGSRLRAVDHREDLVLLGVAHQAVGGLAVGGAEERLGVDDCGLAHHEEPPGSGRLPPSKRGV